jgi:hypothetical protein
MIKGQTLWIGIEDSSSDQFVERLISDYLQSKSGRYYNYAIKDKVGVSFVLQLQMDTFVFLEEFFLWMRQNGIRFFNPK